MKKIKILLCFFISIFLLSGCTTKLDLSDYISEYRKNIYSGSKDSYTVFVYYSDKETPYNSDGIKGNVSSLVEIRLFAPTTDNTYFIDFTIEGNNYSAELAFDSIKQCFKYSQTLSLNTIDTFNIMVSNGVSQTQIEVKSVLPESTITTQQIIQIACQNEVEKIESLKNRKFFDGEIQIRLIYEDEKCYYFVGIVDKSGQTNALLLDAVSGEVLATKILKN